MIPEIDKEWTKFLKTLPETETKFNHKAKDRWCVKMSLKYGFSVKELSKKYNIDKTIP